jgi:tetratricopeptide (TPR) repeat protein
LLERASDAPADARAQALIALGELAWLEARFDESAASYEKVLVISKQIGDKRGMADALCGLGNVARHTGDLVRAREALEESLAIHREMGISGRWPEFSTTGRGRIQRTISRPCGSARGGPCDSRELGDRWGIASRLSYPAEVKCITVRSVEAAAMHRESPGSV